MALIDEKIVAIYKEVEAVEKTRENDGQKFNYRGIDDLYFALHPIFAKHGVFVVPRTVDLRREERESVTEYKGKTTTRTLQTSISKIEYDFVAEDGSSRTASVYGEGMDGGDKATSKSLSGGLKALLIQMFMIPTASSDDPDTNSPEAGSRNKDEFGLLGVKDLVDTAVSLFQTYDEDSVYEHLTGKSALENDSIKSAVRLLCENAGVIFHQQDGSTSHVTGLTARIMDKISNDLVTGRNTIDKEEE